MEVDEALVHLQLVAIPGLGTLTARGLTGGNLEVLGGETDGACVHRQNIQVVNVDSPSGSHFL